jgi:hypothetical protein
MHRSMLAPVECSNAGTVTAAAAAAAVGVSGCAEH